METLFSDLPREVSAGRGADRQMRYRFRCRVQECSSFGRPRFRAIAEYKHIHWRDEGWKGPKRETAEEAAADANRWLDQKAARPEDEAVGYV